MKQMTNSIKYLPFYFLFFIFYFLLFTCASQPWVAPQGWAAKKSPIASSPASIQTGKNIYRTNCILCHGEGGKGNGTLAMNLNPRPADHTSKKFQQQKDGEIFYKITTGRNAMPNFSQLLSENDIWNIINFIRSLEVKAKPVPLKKPAVTIAVTATTTTTATASVPPDQQKNTSNDTSAANKTTLTVKAPDAMVAHKDSIAVIKNI